MYSIQPLGSVPNIDPVVDKDIRTSGATSLIITSGVAPCLEIGAVGGTSETYINGAYNNAFTFSTSNHCVSWGVALQPISALLETDSPLWFEFNIDVQCYLSSTTNMNIFTWFGQESGAGTPAQGFDNTENLVPEFHLLPIHQLSGRNAHSDGQILLRNVVSSAINNDDINMVGFSIYDSSGSGTLSMVQYSIYARYVTGSLSTSFKGT